MANDSFDRVSGIIGEAMSDAWKKIIHDLADVASGRKSASAASVGAHALVLDDIKEFFRVAGGANLAINFPAVVPRTPIGVFYADVIEHGVPSARSAATPGTKGVTGNISIGIGISF